MNRKYWQNPYIIRNDRVRLFALISRDVRLVLIAAVFAFAGLAPHAKEVLVWLHWSH
jgi:hypothetical protein